MWDLTRSWVRVLLLVSAVVSANSMTRAEEEAAQWDADRVLKTIDLVIQNHIDPPTKQSLIVAFLHDLKKDLSAPAPLGLGRKVSMLSGPQLRAFLNEAIAEANQKHSSDIVFELLNNALSRTANTQLITKTSHRVEESLDANRYVGIGIAIHGARNRAVMGNIVKGGPADLVGAKKGDQILKVDGVPTDGHGMLEVIDMLRGEQGSEVTLELKRGEQPAFECTMRRDVVPFKHVSGFYVIEPGIAYVKVDRVTKSIVRDLRQLTPQINEHQVRGLVIDLWKSECDYRSALLLANALTPSGSIGGVQTEKGIELVKADEDALWPDLKIAIVPRFKLQDELAWAVSGLGLHGDVIVSPLSTAGASANRTAWKYGAIDLSSQLGISEHSLVLRVPVARLLGIVENPLGKMVKNREPRFYDLSQYARAPSMRIRPANNRPVAGRNWQRMPTNSIEYATLSLKAMIE